MGARNGLARRARVRDRQRGVARARRRRGRRGRRRDRPRDRQRPAARREALLPAVRRRLGDAAKLTATALVHDYLNQRGGAERVFAHVAGAWPQAPVYTALYDERAVGDLVPAARVRTSFLQRFPLHDRLFRAYAPLYPRAFEAFDLSAYDVVVSSTTAWAKGVLVRPGAVHVCYINTVSRFVFDAARYVGGFGIGRLAQPLIRRLAAWDVRAAQRPTRFVANSRNVAQRVRRWYGREADVLPCPVDVERFTLGPGNGDYFIVVSRLLPYKRIDLAIAACAIAGVPLHIVGTGPDDKRLKALALGTRTTFHGAVD
ncbi:MAG: glycosyltransferase, partial [Candidatus Eremiobacteraeota bacterium]|nr:glycosyltransferase [Candidatus Eremiobacteraeota bacterium]